MARICKRSIKIANIGNMVVRIYLSDEREAKYFLELQIFAVWYVLHGATCSRRQIIKMQSEMREP